MQDLASELSKIFWGRYPRTLTANTQPGLWPGAGWCWDPNLGPPQLFSRGCSPGYPFNAVAASISTHLLMLFVIFPTSVLQTLRFCPVYPAFLYVDVRIVVYLTVSRCVWSASVLVQWSGRCPTVASANRCPRSVFKTQHGTSSRRSRSHHSTSRCKPWWTSQLRWICPTCTLLTHACTHHSCNLAISWLFRPLRTVNEFTCLLTYLHTLTYTSFYQVARM